MLKEERPRTESHGSGAEDHRLSWSDHEDMYDDQMQQEDDEQTHQEIQHQQNTAVRSVLAEVELEEKAVADEDEPQPKAPLQRLRHLRQQVKASYPQQVQVVVQNDADSDISASDNISVSSASHLTNARSRHTKIMDTIMLRRRREQDEDCSFWGLVLFVSIGALTLISGLTYYLVKSDFFTAYETELLGATIDERFTVVSRLESQAAVLLKNGYTNIPYAQATIGLHDGVLRIGRESFASSEKRFNFKGIRIYTNGTVKYTTEVDTPKITAEQVYAKKALVFQDGTTMTTAADVSGGLQQKGDLNFASTKGAIVSSTGGKQRLRVNADGSIAFIDAQAKAPADPALMGFVFDPLHHKMRIANDFEIDHQTSGSRIKTSKSLHFDTDTIILGSGANDASNEVILKCPDQGQVSLHNQKAMALVITGQEVFGKGAGGDVFVSGGKASSTGGSVSISGGSSTSNAKTRGPVYINSDKEAESHTFIGADSQYSTTHLNGNIRVNDGMESAGISFQVSGEAKFEGEKALIATSDVQVGDLEKTTKTSISGKTIDVGQGASTTVLGDEKDAIVKLRGKEVEIAGATLLLGNKKQGQTKLEGNTIELDATSDILIGMRNVSHTVVRGRVQIGEGKEIQVWDRKALYGGQVIQVGDTSTTSVGVTGSSIVMESKGTAAMSGNQVSISSKGKLELGHPDAADASATTLVSGFTTTVDASVSTLVGPNSAKIEVGGKQAKVSIDGSELKLKSGTTIIDGSKKISIGPTEQKNAGGIIEIGVASERLDLATVAGDVTIGSNTGTIHLKGTVAINGEQVSPSRRRLVDEETRPNFVSVTGSPTAIQVAEGDVVLPLDRIVPDERVWSLERSTNQVVRAQANPTASYYTVSLVMNNIRGVSNTPETFPLLRCQVYNDKTRILEVTSFIDIVSSAKATGDPFFGSLAGSSVAELRTERIALSIHCQIRSKGVNQLIYDQIQLSVVALSE